jgi:glyoxylase-like metal-dependent hydrolase (beta-lactamase superfamily II)
VDPELEYPFPVAPDHGTTVEIADGVRWLRMPLPYSLDHINLWALRDGSAWTLVDTGVRSRKVQALWEQIFTDGLDGLPVRRLIVTHFHPDHAGLAGWLCERLGIELWMPRTEWLFARMLTMDAPDDVPEDVLAFYQRAGFDATMLEMMRAAGYGHYRKRVSPLPASYRRIQDSDRLQIDCRAWQVIVGTGHSPEHACLYCPELELMIGGDQVLAKISPHIGVYPSEPEADPLGDYLDSLPRFRELPADTLVLPSHILPYRGLHRRLDSLSRHHDERLARLRRACAEPRTAAELVPMLFDRELNPMDFYMATAETLSHLNHSRATGEIERIREPERSDVYRLVPAA